MAKVSLSFENDSVKVVFTERRGGRIKVKDYILLDWLSFKEFLKKDKTKSFYVTGTFPETLEEVITVPPIKGKPLQDFIRKELKRRYPDVDDFVFRFNDVGADKVRGTTARDVLVTALPVESVDSLLYEFVQNKKDVIQLQPDILAIFNMLPAFDCPVLVLFVKDTVRVLFFIHDNRIHMVRKITGVSKEIDDFDIQNINMTVNYCRQNLKIEPRMLYIAGPQRISSNLFPLIPVATLMLKDIEFPSMRAASYDRGDEEAEDLQNTLMLTLAGLFKPRLGNLISPSYRLYRIIKKYLNLALPLFVVALVFFAFMVFSNSKDVVRYEREINTLQQRIGDIAVAFNELKTLEKKKDDIVYINSLIQGSSYMANPGRVLSIISSSDLAGVDLQEIRIDFKRVESKGNGLTAGFSLEGKSPGSGYAEILRNYRAFLDSLKRYPRIRITGEDIDVERKRFVIQGELKL